MAIIDSIGHGLDRLIGVFSPRLEYARRGARKITATARAESYAAAKTTRPGGDWSPTSGNVNDVLRGSIPTVRARIRQLVRDFPYFAKAVNSLCDYSIGSGLTYQARLKDSSGNMRRLFNQRLEDAFNFWADDCDIAGKLHYYEMMRLAKRQDLENGEFIFVKVINRNNGKYLPYELQMFEADWLESDNTKWVSQSISAANTLDQGIEYETNTGRVIAYHFMDPDGWGRSTRIPAESIIHGFETHRPGQLRGISPFTAGVVVAKDLSSYLDSEIDGAKLAAKYLAFVKSNDPFERQTALTESDDDGNKIETIESAIIEYLRPGEDITLSSHSRPGDAFEPFTRLVLQMVSASTGCPYEILSADYRGLNYNTTRVSRNDFTLQLRPTTTRHIRHFCNPTIEPFFQFLQLTGTLRMPGFESRPWQYLQQCAWQPPGMEAIDPLRESKARIEEIKAGLRSPQEIIASRGRDMEEVLTEISEFKRLAGELELGDMVDEMLGQSISTSTVNNPAAIDTDTNEEADRSARPKLIEGGRMERNNVTRDGLADNKLNFRKLAVPSNGDGGPKSLDTDTRSVSVIGLTEEPAQVFDWERGEVINEILRMDGVEMPKNGQVPLLDSHAKFGTDGVIGSFRNMEVEENMLTGRVYFSSAPEAEGPYTKLREGHLTDFSGGYRPIKSVWVPAGETQKVAGRSYKGPVMIRTRWRVKELSIVAIGADELAKARADTNQKTIKEKEIMDPRLRKYLERKGLPENATEKQAWEFFGRMDAEAEDDNQRDNDAAAASVNNADNSNQVDPAEIGRQAAEREVLRVREIENLRQRFKLPQEMVDNMISDGTSAELVRKAVLDYVTATAAVTGGVGHRTPVEVSADERDKWREAAQGAMLIRAGGLPEGEKPAPGADDLAGHNLVEIARNSLRVANQKQGGHIMDMIGRAFTTSDFPYILADVANKSLFMGYDTAEETWSIWADTGSVSDFKTHNLPRMSEADDLDEVPEHGEYKYGKFTEAREQYSIATYGKLFAVTRQTIINDDLQALTAVPRAHGEAAARKVGDLPYAVLTANANMGDGVALFASGHSNLVADGSGAAPGDATVTAGVLAMGTQKDLQDKRRLNIPVRFLIAPKALQGGTEKFFRSEYYSDEGTIGTPDSATAATRANIYYNTDITRVYDARLDDNDAAAWFLAGPRGKTVTVFFLNGIQRPYLETRDGWKVDGVEYKVRIDAGAKALDYRGLYMNDGN